MTFIEKITDRSSPSHRFGAAAHTQCACNPGCMSCTPSCGRGYSAAKNVEPGSVGGLAGDLPGSGPDATGYKRTKVSKRSAASKRAWRTRKRMKAARAQTSDETVLRQVALSEAA